MSLAIALGANLPSPAGEPLHTLLAVRPLLAALLAGLGGSVRWSPLFRTAPVGGPPGQPDYLNAVVLVSPARAGSGTEALALLAALQGLEQRFARQRLERWAPRSLDLDLLWWGDLVCCGESLELPHPRLLERSFVLAPLAAIDRAPAPPGADSATADLLRTLVAGSGEPAPRPLPPRPGWPEWARLGNCARD
ncbi:MAG: 2-amino-4-hydroxy-6-hydroxymethyldihydropteridine diphosphokinase [Cyanobium sp.]